MWQSKGRSGYGDVNLDGTYDDAILGLSPNGRQYRNEATLETRALSGHDYWHLRKQITPAQDIPEALYARNETEAMSHTLANGQANLLKYADPVPTKKASAVSIKDRILPQFKRLQTLRTQMLDLEKEYKTTDMTCEEYSVLRDIVVTKIQRQEVLYKRAASVKPIRPETDEDSAEYTFSSLSNASDDDGYGEEVIEAVGVEWIDELPEKNSLKSFLKMSCKVVRKAVQFSQATRNYIKTLSEV